MDHCLLCRSSELDDILPDRPFCGVTSDAKYRPAMGTVCVCASCGHVQKRITPAWLACIDAVYADYSVFFQPGGEDQACFSTDGSQESRLHAVARTLVETLNLPAHGKLLDFGCGVGSFLQAFHTFRPDWELYGLDQCGQFRDTVRQRPGVSGFFSCLEEVSTRFNLITFNDVFEHLLEPVTILASLAAVVQKNGFVFIRSPDFTRNAFDLPVVDHCSHFTGSSLRAAVRLAGFSPLEIPFPWLPKEAGVLAAPRPPVQPEKTASPAEPDHRQVCSRQIHWLQTMLTHFSALTSGQSGVFGCSLAGIWTAGMLPDHFSFFTEEDTRRLGTGAFGLPILTPAESPAGAQIVLPFPALIAADLRQRLHRQHPHLRLMAPPL